MTPTENHMPDLNRPKHSLMTVDASAIRDSNFKTDKSWELDDSVSKNITHKNACDGPTKRPKRRRNPKDDGFVALLCRWIVQHQIGLAINLLLLHALTHFCFPRARPRTRKFHLLSYYNAETKRYAAGWDDFYMVLYSIIVLTGLRAAALDYVLVPLAKSLGVTKSKDKVRFAEQGWVVIYDSIIWSLGMYIMYTHEHWMNLRELWTGWPNRELEGSMKWYYLVQFAFWLQQILVVHIEERRKDHWQMFSHHIVTCVLMFASYGYHQTKVGNLILCLMDVVDLFLAFAKILKYLQFQMACDIAFGVFMLVWLVARHVYYLTVVYSIYADTPKVITSGCYSGTTGNLTGPFEAPDDYAHLVDPFLDPQGIVCWNNQIKWTFINLLLALQVLLCIWFGMIVKVALKVLRGGEAEDSRSDDEGDDAEEAEVEELIPTQRPLGSGFEAKAAYTDRGAALRPLEEEVGADEIDLSKHRHSPARIFRRSGGVASGVNLHSDRKELLGRIGCDKQPE